jgi:enterochelin esterase-like enzyme
MATHAKTRPVGPVVDKDGVTFRVPDPDRRLSGVRLWQEVRVPGDQLDFSYAEGGWTLRLDRPDVDRMEYMYELSHEGGGTETVLDPANPLRTSGVFGDHSVVEFPEYETPSWLSAPTAEGTRLSGATKSASLSGEVSWQVWSPVDLPEDDAAPLLLVHDGPEFDALAGITTYAAALVAEGRLPKLRVALLAPGPRDERYSANAAYARALALAVLPDVRAVAPPTKVVGIGASLGALSMLTLHRRHPDAVDGLFLQSGSFFHRRLDADERRFQRFARIERFVSDTLRAENTPRTVPITMTCGRIEGNLDNNRMIARALGAQGYDVTFVEVGDMHNYTAWRDALDPHLTELVQKVTSE